DLAPAFEAEEEESPVVLDRSADSSPKLVLIVQSLGRAAEVIGKGVSVEDRIAEVIKHGSMESVGASLHDHIDCAAACAPVLGVVGIGHYIDFLDPIDIGRDFPCTVLLDCDWCAVESELIVTPCAHAVDDIAAIHVPAAGAGKSLRPKLS